MTIHKSARQIGTIEFKNGNRVQLWLGHNRNTGQRILWQSLNGGRAGRSTGRNLIRILEEIDVVIATDEGRWIGTRNSTALITLFKEAGI